MFIAERLRQTNIAEYLLYMWQVEDLLRALSLDIERVTETCVNAYPDGLEPAQREALTQWYADLIGMMHAEGITTQGHLQICKNILIDLTSLHAQLIESSKFPYYRKAYYDALSVIVELRARGGAAATKNEIETAFNFLYGIMLLHLQQKPIAPSTEQALKTITIFIGTLSDYYLRDKSEPISF